MGAIDGKHVTIKTPVNSGSNLFNYKHSFSVVMMALVDADYKFIYCDVGCNGRISDGGVFAGCSLDEAMQKKTANIPKPQPAPGDERPISYSMVADEAFPLRENIMKPYPHRSLEVEKRIFNYRLSRAIRVVENAFGILANRFRIFLTPIALPPATVEKIVLASCSLHNLLRTEAGTAYVGALADRENPETREVTPGLWRSDQALQKAPLPVGTNPTARAKTLRDYVCTYYVNSEVGSVAWQWDKV